MPVNKPNNKKIRPAPPPPPPPPSKNSIIMYNVRIGHFETDHIELLKRWIKTSFMKRDKTLKIETELFLNNVKN